MAKRRIDYSALFSYNEKKQMYYTKRDGKQYWSKDPERLHEKIQGLDQPEEPSTPTFKDVAEEWHNWKWEAISDNTKVCYSPYYNRLVDELGDIDISDLTAADFQRIILQAKTEGYSAKTVKTIKGVAKMIMDYAIVQDPPLITFNPLSAITVPRGLPKKKRSAPEEDIRRIIDENVRSAYFGLFPFLLVYTGCRKGEALALTWGDIDFENKTVCISKSYAYPSGMPVLKEPKTEAGIRTVPLFPSLAEELLAARPKNAKPHDLIFSMPGNAPMQENAYKRHWTHWAKDVGLVEDDPVQTKGKNGRLYTKHNFRPKITAHQLRHLFVTLCFEAGVDAETTKTWAGHADIQTTLQIYTDLRKKHENTQKKRMERFLKKGKNGLT